MRYIDLILYGRGKSNVRNTRYAFFCWVIRYPRTQLFDFSKTRSKRYAGLTFGSLSFLLLSAKRWWMKSVVSQEDLKLHTRKKICTQE